MRKGLLKTIFFACFLTFMVTGCGNINELKISQYKMNKIDGLAGAECREFLQEAIRNEADVKIGNTNWNREKSIYLVYDSEYAKELGYSLENMNEGAFVIVNKENSIYIIAPTEAGVKRASSYFASNYIGENGVITLAAGEDYIDLGTKVKTQLYVGEVAIEEYEITYSAKKLEPSCQLLQYYIQQTAETVVSIVPERQGDETSIHLSLNKDLAKDEGKCEIIEGEIFISAGSEESLQEEVYLFANTYLGWMYAGEEKERISSVPSVLRIPTNITVQEAWMPEREAIVTLWNLNYSRGIFLDPDVSVKNNILNFSEEQIYEYVKMLKYCGFTGVQVTEMCSTWAATDGYETPHEKIRMIADAAHSLDMKFTMWVWGAEFSDCGWSDESVVFVYKNGGYAFEDPDVIANFEKYYSIYAELADCCDRIIGHYYDPGNLVTAEDIAYFAKMLKDKCHAVNPDIDFGISCWVDAYDKNVFIETLGNDITLYEGGYHSDENTYVPFRTQISNLGCRLGTWAWNTCEMETDQLAQMNFNMEIIRSVYQTARKYDGIAKPSYWSEMDAYHVLNVFSLYCAGHLLINPDMESAELYEQISTSAVGPEYAADFAELLSIIQDARSGYSFDTASWSSENYILKSDAYPAEELVERCNAILPVLQEMIDKGIESYTLPLPMSLQELLQLIQPHIVQIRDYAQFRVNLKQLEADYADGVDLQEISERLYVISEPIKNYTCVIGAWGQIEARAQYEMVMDFCSRTGLEVPMHATFQNERKQRILYQLISWQYEVCYEPYTVNDEFYQWGLAFGEEETARLVQELVDDGLLVRIEDGRVHLANWENYIYHVD